jgi:integrase/recombinase XerD
MIERTTAQKKAKELSKFLREENPDYDYLKNVFKYLRKELEIEVVSKNKKLPYVPTEDELKKFYDIIWASDKHQDVIILKTFLYTGIRVSELINVKLTDVDFRNCQIRISEGKGNKDRMVPFPDTFREILSMHCKLNTSNDIKYKRTYLFESSWKKKYTDRGIRKILAKYSKEAGFERNISPHKLRHFLFTWLKRNGIDDALIQPYSGHESRKSLEIYSKLSITDAQNEYNSVIKNFPI